MSQLFKPGVNTLARVSIAGGLATVVLALGMLLVANFSPYTIHGNYAGIAVAQPVRFSHELHSGQLNISCMYCHQQAEVSPYGGIPDTQTCMTCHANIAVYSELLQPVRDSWANDEPLIWLRVHDLAEHVYFNHSVHVQNGFACETCHGNVAEMPQVWQAEKQYMGWCLECHLAPEEFVRPLETRYEVGYEYPENQTEFGTELLIEYGVYGETEDSQDTTAEGIGLTTCATCHR
ncbi:MAG: cytochrome c3 family protein [Chloroflexota bacterium]